jgi:hypothetical protein
MAANIVDRLDLHGVLLEEGITYEVVMVSSSSDSQPHVAPIGIRLKKNHLLSRVYTDTITYSNLSANSLCTLNLIRDGRIFYLALYDKEQLARQIERRDGFWVITGSEGWLGLRVADIQNDSREARMFEFEAVDGGPLTHPTKGYSRADTALVEMLVHSTRIAPFLKQGRTEDAKMLVELLRHYYSLIKRVCPGTDYEIYADDILKRSLTAFERSGF